ncbi:MAG: CAP domain-containing protein [Patescibacteria group bacterium]|nr:CAP domain-containing protein [Patescibacteria group bacterium]
MKNKKITAVSLVKKQKIAVLIASLCIIGSFLLPKLIFATEITSENLIKITNQERIRQKLKPLRVNKTLENAATNKANDLLKGQYFSHTSPEGKNFIEWIKEVKYDYLYAGENLAMDFITSEGVVKAWMQSKNHKANILSPYYTEIAIIVKSGILNKRFTTIAVQLFGTPKQISENNLAINNEFILSEQIINNKEKILVFPSILNYKNFDIIYLDSKNFVTETNKVSMASNAPYKKSFKIPNNKLNPKVAGENTQFFYKQNSVKNRLPIFYSLMSLILFFSGLVLLFLNQHYIYSEKENYNKNLCHMN